MDTRRDVFQAIADPTRRQIINLIAHNTLNVNAIAGNFNTTRQAISLHIRILEECGLILIRQQGREKYCEAQLHKLNEVHEWTEQYRQFWSNKMQALKHFLETESTGRKAVAGKRSKAPIKSKRK